MPDNQKFPVYTGADTTPCPQHGQPYCGICTVEHADMCDHNTFRNTCGLCRSKEALAEADTNALVLTIRARAATFTRTNFREYTQDTITVIESAMMIGASIALAHQSR